MIDISLSILFLKQLVFWYFVIFAIIQCKWVFFVILTEQGLTWFLYNDFKTMIYCVKISLLIFFFS